MYQILLFALNNSLSLLVDVEQPSTIVILIQTEWIREISSSSSPKITYYVRRGTIIAITFVTTKHTQKLKDVYTSRENLLHQLTRLNFKFRIDKVSNSTLLFHCSWNLKMYR